MIGPMNKKVKTILKRLGAPKLVRLYGEESIESIANILQDSINENKLVSLLFQKYGKQFLANKSIRMAVYAGLTDGDLGYILDGKDDGSRVLTRAQREKLAGLPWGRTKKSSIRAVEVLDLDASYLPAVYEIPQTTEIVKPSVFLYPHQQRLKDAFIRELNSGASRLLVHMPTGAGKTRTSIEGLVDYWKANADRSNNIVWLAHSEELCEQAIETFVKIWKVRGEKEIKVCRLWGGHSFPDVSEGNCFIVAGFQKLYSMLSSDNDKVFRSISALKNTVGFIIVDEAHKAIAPTYKSCISYLFTPGKTKLVGLTATPGRGADDIDAGNLYESETNELARYFDRRRVGLTGEDGMEIDNPIGYLQERGFLSRINRKKVTTDVEIELSDKEQKFIADFLDLPASVLKKLAKNDERNALILGEIAALATKKRQIIVFALSVEHSHFISELLNLQGISACCIDGSTQPSERADAIEAYKASEISVLVNYGVLTTGFDAPNTNAVVIARPTASLVLYSQMIGRGIRGLKVGGNAQCDLVDLEDNLLGFPSEQQAFNHFNVAWR